MAIVTTILNFIFVLLLLIFLIIFISIVYVFFLFLSSMSFEIILFLSYIPILLYHMFWSSFYSLFIFIFFFSSFSSLSPPHYHAFDAAINTNTNRTGFSKQKLSQNTLPEVPCRLNNCSASAGSRLSQTSQTSCFVQMQSE